VFGERHEEKVVSLVSLNGPSNLKLNDGYLSFNHGGELYIKLREKHSSFDHRCGI